MTREEALEILNTIPTIHEQVDALEMAIEALENQKTGHWIKDEEMSIMFDIWKCSECGGGGDKHFKYCSYCGSKME
ncbi:MAG: hypothetical protein J6S67_14945 [Methanobrevibacter sp.]|nr:hypothetical protein [Methanobrevibacter sp.]